MRRALIMAVAGLLLLTFACGCSQEFRPPKGSRAVSYTAVWSQVHLPAGLVVNPSGKNVSEADYKRLCGGTNYEELESGVRTGHSVYLAGQVLGILEPSDPSYLSSLADLRQAGVSLITVALGRVDKNDPLADTTVVVLWVGALPKAGDVVEVWADAEGSASSLTVAVLGRYITAYER